MCGLFGCRLRKPDPRAGTFLAVSGTLMDQRGGHSWGFYNEHGITKDVGLFSTHVRLNDFGSRVFMGHCRYATVGDITKENSHPFLQGSVVGAHNGGVPNYKELNEQYGRDLKVDSQQIFEQMDRDLPLDEVVAYGAISYIKESDVDTMNLLRFNGGSLYVAQVWEDGDSKDPDPLGTFWASTESALRAGIVTSGFTRYRIFEPKLDRLFTVGDDGVIRDSETDIDFGHRYTYETKKEKEEKAAKDFKKDTHLGMTGGIARYATGTYVNGRWVSYGSRHGYGGQAKDTGDELDEVVTAGASGSLQAQYEDDKSAFRARCFACGKIGRMQIEFEMGAPLCYLCYLEYAGPEDPKDEFEAAIRRAVAGEAFQEPLALGSGDKSEIPF